MYVNGVDTNSAANTSTRTGTNTHPDQEESRLIKVCRAQSCPGG